MVLLNSSTRRDTAGKIVGVLGVGQDITILNEYKENLELKVINRTQELAFQNDEKDKRAAELVIANKELAFQNNEKEKRADELGIANKELDFQNEEKEKRAQELGIANKELAFQNEEKEKRAQELGIANKELEQFSFLASHDLQEPLRTVINYMEVFEEDYFEILDETALKYLGSVRDATERMRILIKSLLDFSRLGRNRSFEYIDCRKLINEAIADLNSMIKASNAIIEISEMPTLSLYQIEVRELFQNLIMNAIKFQKQGQQPVIQIRCEEIDNVWKFSIIDNGIGIDPIYFERIFDIFQCLHTNDEYEGTGIGLANCKKIVQLHQGEIWLESTIGKGTSFYFTIHK
jgi:light-regulated signal transduction histidine kinase (bacteriophytochrome)